MDPAKTTAPGEPHIERGPSASGSITLSAVNRRGILLLLIVLLGAGQLSAAMFLPGSEALIAGRDPNFWAPFNASLPRSARVGRVIEWLDLPAGKRPTLDAVLQRSRWCRCAQGPPDRHRVFDIASPGRLTLK